jgi:glycosyltransferase involved in cell wall biosynthesis
MHSFWETTRLSTSTGPRRLAMVITELEPGGAERALVELATRLDPSRYTPVVYSLGAPPAEEKQSLVQQLAKANISTHFLGYSRATQYFALVRDLASRLREQRADIVQSFLFHANIVAARAARAASIRRVVTSIRVADPRRWRTQLERIATAHADRFVCVSQSVAEFSRRRGFAAEKLVVIPNGVDLAKWQNAPSACFEPFGVAAGRRVLLYVGRLDKQKGLDRFFGELAALFRELSEHELVLVGDGPLRPSLQRRVAESDFSHRVHFLGWRDDVPRLMAGCQMLVLPSRWEGMPNVVLEAMAAGKPVVATQSEGTVELLGLGALDQTVPVGAWEALRSRIAQLAKDKALITDLGERNRARAQQFSLQSVAERFQRLYDSLLP